MPPSLDLAPQRSRLGVLLDHLATSDDPRDVRRSVHPLAEILPLVVCATIATAIQGAGADYLLAFKANQPTLRAEVEACFAAALPGTVTTHAEHDKGHGRIEQRTTHVQGGGRPSSPHWAGSAASGPFVPVIAAQAAPSQTCTATAPPSGMPSARAPR